MLQNNIIVFSVYETYFLSLKYQLESQKASLTCIEILTFTKKGTQILSHIVKTLLQQKVDGWN
mgnify:CR=1 FL=1